MRAPHLCSRGMRCDIGSGNAPAAATWLLKHPTTLMRADESWCTSFIEAIISKHPNERWNAVPCCRLELRQAYLDQMQAYHAQIRAGAYPDRTADDAGGGTSSRPACTAQLSVAMRGPAQRQNILSAR